MSGASFVIFCLDIHRENYTQYMELQPLLLRSWMETFCLFWKYLPISNYKSSLFYQNTQVFVEIENFLLNKKCIIFHCVKEIKKLMQKGTNYFLLQTFIVFAYFGSLKFLCLIQNYFFIYFFLLIRRNGKWM